MKNLECGFIGAGIESIKKAVRDAIKIGKHGGGFILGSSDSFRDGTPVENVRAYFDAAISIVNYPKRFYAVLMIMNPSFIVHQAEYVSCYNVRRDKHTTIVAFDPEERHTLVDVY